MIKITSIDWRGILLDSKIIATKSVINIKEIIDIETDLSNIFEDTD